MHVPRAVHTLDGTKTFTHYGVRPPRTHRKLCAQTTRRQSELVCLLVRVCVLGGAHSCKDYTTHIQHTRSSRCPYVCTSACTFKSNLDGAWIVKSTLYARQTMDVGCTRTRGRTRNAHALLYIIVSTRVVLPEYNTHTHTPKKLKPSRVRSEPARHWRAANGVIIISGSTCRSGVPRRCTSRNG